MRPDDISVAVISTVRMCEYEIYEASGLMLVSHLIFSSGCIGCKMHGDKRSVRTYRSSEITTVIRDPLMVGPARLVYLRKYVNLCRYSY